jgi:hypothetical protein
MAETMNYCKIPTMHLGLNLRLPPLDVSSWWQLRPVGPHYPEYNPWTSSFGVNRELVRNAESPCSSQMN